MLRWFPWMVLACAGVAFVGCKDAASPSGDTPQVERAAPPAPRTSSTAADSVADAGAQPEVVWTAEKLHEAFKAANEFYTGAAQFAIDDGKLVAADLSNSGITDLSPLAGCPLRALDLRQTPVEDLEPIRGAPLLELYLEQTRVKDLGPLRGAPLVKLYISNTSVDSLAPLEGLPLVELNALGTGVNDLSPLRGAPLEMLWLTETPVSDISPLRECPLVSLTLHRTQVRDLTPLAGTALTRLHIGETPVTDLTPLQGLRLTRLIFDPHHIKTGLEVARRMPTLTELGTTFEERMPPDAFWRQFPDETGVDQP